MQSLSLNPPAIEDIAREVVHLEAVLAQRRAELAALREESHEFKARYTCIVGSRLAELAEVESAIREAERCRLNLAAAEDEDESAAIAAPASAPAMSGPTALRKLFWSVARLFHPDHAGDEHEARRRHSIMAEANRAYREGDVESLSTLLGDEDLQLYCAGTHGEGAEDAAARLASLKDELRTIEFGIKRIKQDGLYRLKLAADEEARQGRDALVAQAERVARQIVKARRRLAHLS